MYPWLVADVGGTNIRFNLVTNRDVYTGAYLFSEHRDYTVSNFDTFYDCLSEYISTLADRAPKYACIAVAGPVGPDRVQLTNAEWCFSVQELRRLFSFEHLEVINDFFALACSLAHLKTRDCIQVVPGEPNENGVKAVVGPGTGLGVAALIKHHDAWLPVSTEGGHSAFSPQTPRELEVFIALQKKLRYVAVENILSGPGLVNIYQTLGSLDNCERRELAPAQITARALAGTDSLAQETLDIFCATLGTVCGDFALCYGATGGVYLAGGILPVIREYLVRSEFADRFRQKGIMSSYLDAIPVRLIVHGELALIGAAAWLQSRSTC
ncbi:MAG: glucokinase [Gammaproteobacteria bacterium]|nr:glucokinase [Gammaproteobacteria bacterium]MDE0285790.1 glucokinase [Gammaproteobacteria bacterium]